MTANEDKKQESSSAERQQLSLKQQLFSLKFETDYRGTMQLVKSDVEFHSGNIWALVFASLIASVGLNVNSTAVIIGAMLISPLMGPIVGAGFGLATNDFRLLRRSVRNMLIAAAVALVASTLYFVLSPLEEVQSELLARTRPTLYDVLIAMFGGGAGVIAVSRKSTKGNVVPGVAIATALIPPLCTAGFGLAQRNLWFFLGALHLFFINTLFICLATLALARLMHFRRVAELDSSHILRMRITITAITLAIVIPSIYTGWNIIQETRFKNVARRFISENLNLSDRAILNPDLNYSPKGSLIKATLLGKPLSKNELHELKEKLSAYGLKNTDLILNQPAENQTTIEQVSQMVRQGILEDIYTRNEKTLADRDERIHALEDEVIRLRSTEFHVGTISKELAALYPELISLGVGKEEEVNEKMTNATSTTVVVVATWHRMPSSVDQKKLRSFLELRLGLQSIHLVNTTKR